MTRPDKPDNLINWYDVLEKYGIGSWQLQTWVTDPRRKLVPAKWDSSKDPPELRGRPSGPMTELEFVMCCGQPEDIFFRVKTVEKHIKEHREEIERRAQDRSQGKSDCDWTETLSWEILAEEWGYVDHLGLFQRFFKMGGKLEPFSWDSGKGRPEERLSDLGHALGHLPDLSDVKFCRKHVDIYARKNWRDLPHSAYLAAKDRRITDVAIGQDRKV